MTIGAKDLEIFVMDTGTKDPGNESSRNVRSRGTKVPRSVSLCGLSAPGTKVQRNEMSMTFDFHVEVTIFSSALNNSTTAEDIERSAKNTTYNSSN